MKVVINNSPNHFGISMAAAEFMAKRGDTRAARELKYFQENQEEWWGDGYVEDEEEYLSIGNYKRSCPDLVAAVETLGPAASYNECKLEILEIPDGVEYQILFDEDGYELFVNKNQIWTLFRESD